MSDVFGAVREDCLRALPFNARVPQRPNTAGVTRECLRLLQARLIGAAQLQSTSCALPFRPAKKPAVQFCSRQN